MSRYFLEIAYNGKNYAGFQVQQNANTVQAEIDKALSLLCQREIITTGSSRTDKGVHARHNVVHADIGGPLHPQFIYKVNAILPPDIVLKTARAVKPEAHARFSALSRFYRYDIYNFKNPFLRDAAYYFPYTIELSKMKKAAGIILEHKDFTSFSKRNTQVNTFICDIKEAAWIQEDILVRFEVRSNRFLRGMVRGLVATMLQIGRGKIGIEEFKGILLSKNGDKADFSAPAQGLYLCDVEYPEEIYLS